MMKKNKILFLIPTLGHGGAERVLVNLANNMDKTRFDVTVQTLFDVGIYQSQIHEDVRYIPGLKYYFPGNTKVMTIFHPRTLFRFFVKEKYDLIVSYLEGSAARVVSGRGDGTKTVAWIHIEQETPERAASSFRSIKEAEVCYSAFDRIVGVSKTVLNDFNKVLRVNTEKSVIYNVVETEKIRKLAIEDIGDALECSARFRLCSVAKLMPTKGYDRMVPIVRKLLDNGISVHMFLIGCGGEEARLRNFVSEYGLENDWTFLGFKDNPYKYVANCDLYVCSSRREGFSTSVTESLIVGTPVVSTNCSGASELLGENNEFGIVTDNDEKALYEGIYRILSTEGLLEHYQKQAEERGSFLSTAERVKDAEKMFEEVIAE